MAGLLLPELSRDTASCAEFGVASHPSYDGASLRSAAADCFVGFNQQLQLTSDGRLDVVVRDECIKVTCGDATQRVRWLGHVGIARYDEKNYQGWKILGVPTKITNREGLPIDMGGLISDVLKDGDTVYVSHSLEPHDVERQV